MDAVSDTEFLEDAGDMRLRGRLADHEPLAGLRVGKAAHEKVEHLALTSGQLGALRWGCRRCGGIAAGELLDHGTHRWWLKTAGSPIEGGRADVAYG